MYLSSKVRGKLRGDHFLLASVYGPEPNGGLGRSCICTGKADLTTPGDRLLLLFAKRGMRRDGTERLEAVDVTDCSNEHDADAGHMVRNDTL